MSSTSGPSAPGRFTTWVRYVLIAVAWLFAAGVVVQIFLAGLGLFESPDYWGDHVDMGYAIGPLAYLLPLLALLGRVGWPRVGHAVVVTLLYVVQTILPTLDAGYLAALHALNAVLVLGAAVSLGGRTLELVRQRR
jgi:Family of unknown function (DUF6220)